MINDARIGARLDDAGYTVLAMFPAELARFIGAEVEKWDRVIRAAEIKPG